MQHSQLLSFSSLLCSILFFSSPSFCLLPITVNHSSEKVMFLCAAARAGERESESTSPRLGALISHAWPCCAVPFRPVSVVLLSRPPPSLLFSLLILPSPPPLASALPYSPLLSSLLSFYFPSPALLSAFFSSLELSFHSSILLPSSPLFSLPLLSSFSFFPLTSSFPHFSSPLRSDPVSSRPGQCGPRSEESVRVGMPVLTRGVNTTKQIRGINGVCEGDRMSMGRTGL